MTGSMLISILLLTVLVTSLVQCGAQANEPPFPKLLDRTNPNRHRIRIVREEFYTDGSYKMGEELIDLGLGKAVYIETANNVRKTWLIDIKDRSFYEYQPFTCKGSVYKRDTLFFGVSAVLEAFIQSPSKQYSRTTGRPAGNGPEQIGHKWSLVTGKKTTHIFFSESTNRTGEAGQTLELVLDSIVEYEGGSKKVTSNILSVEHELPREAYNNELQLPLIYGCKRDVASLDREMQRKLDTLEDDLIDRHHFKANARAINFAIDNPTSTELNIIELALSHPRDANHNISPVRALMIRQQNSQKDIKTVVDHYLNVKYEANMTDGTCTISNVGTMNSPQQTNPIVLQFSDELTLNMSAKDLESILYSVTKESFMKLEQRGADSTQYAYFADTHTGVFGRKSIGRFVRKFSFGANGRSKLESFGIWIFESETRIREVYDFDIFETKSLASDTNSAHAFDMSRECYINDEEALEGRDYAWFELAYSLPANQDEALQADLERLKNSLYRQIWADLSLSYLRIPKMEAIFSENSGSFMIKMLLLDSPALHLVFDELKSLSLYPKYVGASEVVASLRDCSEFCWKKRCTGMTFSRVDHNCSLDTTRTVYKNHLGKDENADTYWIPEKKEATYSLPRLQQQIDALQTSNQDASGMLGFNELNQVQLTGNLRGFGNLRVRLELNGQEVSFAPVSVRVKSESDDVEPEKMVFDDQE